MIKYKNNNKNRWVDLSELPQFEFNNQIRIQWDNSVGCDIPFQYDEACGVIHIVGCRQQVISKNRHRAILSITIGKYVTEPIEVRSDFITNCQLHNCVKNRIINLAPQLMKYLVNQDDAYKYSYHSNQKILMRCPMCGNVELKTISAVYKTGFVCHACSDGISIPNKIMYNILTQLNIKFINEVNRSHGFDWMQSYIYDFYFNINNKDILIEMDGGYHVFQKERDEIKTKLAIDNNFNIIRIDCAYLNTDAVEYIKNNILNSELCNILQLDKVDWDECRLATRNSIMIQACSLWENDNLSVLQISDRLNFNRHTIAKYLNRGKKLGLCNSYNTNTSRNRGILCRNKQYQTTKEVFI